MAQYGDNVFAIIGDASRRLKQAGRSDEAKAMAERCLKAKSYDEACDIVDEYLDKLKPTTEAENDAEWDEYWAEQDGNR